VEACNAQGVLILTLPIQCACFCSFLSFPGPVGVFQSRLGRHEAAERGGFRASQGMGAMRASQQEGCVSARVVSCAVADSPSLFASAALFSQLSSAPPTGMAWTSSSYGPGVGAAEAHMQQLYAAGDASAQAAPHAFPVPAGGESFAHARGGGRQSTQLRHRNSWLTRSQRDE
jgi:hypothetical protein